MTDWMPGVERIESLAHGGAILPRAVMSHIMQGSQKTMVRWAEERPSITPISAHFTIGKDGHIAQHVSIRQQAWHAGRTDGTPTWQLLPAGGNPNNFTVGIEHEGFTGEPWPEPQIAATLRVHRWVFEELKLVASPDTVIGHFMTAPLSRARDPGPRWPRSRIISALTATSPVTKLPQDEYEIAAVQAYFGVLGHSYTVVDDGRWQEIRIRRPRP